MIGSIVEWDLIMLLDCSNIDRCVVTAANSLYDVVSCDYTMAHRIEVFAH